VLEEQGKKQKEPEYRQYPYRYVIMAAYCLLSVVTGMGWVIVTPISVSIAKAYHISDQLVSVLPLSYMVLYAFANFPSNWLIDVKGIRIGILVGATGTFLGALLRCFVAYDFMFIVAGQILCALVQVVILNAPTTIAVRWFLP
jgi:MFS transporter, FLVCR family, feline leukemia virus subgroup C receptor-related protein